jgi:gamma-glutamylcyclotransferase (GGCT)/AIG2-like uncharacterized protein YtfP
MTDICKTLFVYGTLQKGEERCHYLSDCHLLRAIEVPGSLYDTGNGYPAALFDEQSDQTISGELYLMRDPGGKLKELDLVEEVQSGLFQRVLLKHYGMEFFSYQAGHSLKNRTNDEHPIEDGCWRRYSSLAEGNPAVFALNFETLQKKVYKEPASAQSDDQIYIRGDLPILVTAPHATAHVRLGKLKRQEFFTGALAALLHNSTGCHALYTNSLSEFDPNYYDYSPFKDRLSEISGGSGFKFLIDLHGTGPGRSADIFPGTGEAREYLLGNEHYFNALLNSAKSFGINIGGEDVFPAVKQMTVTKYAARKLGVPSMQLEIVRERRNPESSPGNFEKLVQFMMDFITQLSLS